MKVVSLVGARPQFIKEALVGEAARKSGAWEHILIHSGQHYDAAMSEIFFQELAIPTPKYHLGIGSGSHGAMTGAALAAVENVLLQEKPAALLVYGDTNTTLAGALAAAKLHIPVAHVEAGIRMEPKTMPEEINRVLTDRISTVMCCCSELGRKNLTREGIVDGVSVSGDIMYDIFLRMRPRFSPEEVCARFRVTPGGFVLATLHRDYNVDDPHNLKECLEGLSTLAKRFGLTILVPVHPRTRKNMRLSGLEAVGEELSLIDPVGYLDLMSLTCASCFIVTDSGGLQKEAYYAGKRSIVVMPDTGWRELTDCEWNILVAPTAESILSAAEIVRTSKPCPEGIYGNGNAAKKIMEAISRTLNKG